MAPPYHGEQKTNGKRRDVAFAAVVLLLAIVTTYLPPATQQEIASTLQASVLRPFIVTQEVVTQVRHRATEVGVLTAQLDSLTAIMSTQAVLLDENRTLRGLLDLVERTEHRFVPASVIRPGTPGSERMFIVDVGAADGVREGASVVAPHGLVGRITEVRRNASVGMDWSHPDFRVSAMLVDGTNFGIVEGQRGGSHEDDRLILNGTAYNADVRAGMGVVTSGLAGVTPRGIAVGKIHSELDAEGEWRKSFWVEPMVELGSVTHVLVLTEGGAGDYSSIWPPDSLVTREEAITRNSGS